jgi:magnesium chelatase family protein
LYQGRLSGPLRDRIDLSVDVPAVPASVLTAAESGESSERVRARVIDARARQSRRSGDGGLLVNARLEGRRLRAVCRLDADGERLLHAAVSRLGLSARAYDRVRKVARTIADLAGAEAIDAAHLAEALQYRMVD